MMEFESLDVWQRAMDLYENIFRVTQTYPAAEKYGLTSQIRSSADSVPSNIAEGEGRDTRGQRLYFLGVARGSLYELHSRLTMARRVGYEAPDETFALLRDVLNLLRGYIAYVTKKKDR
jgi:four helix bundle protein